MVCKLRPKLEMGLGPQISWSCFFQEGRQTPELGGSGTRFRHVTCVYVQGGTSDQLSSRLDTLTYHPDFVVFTFGRWKKSGARNSSTRRTSAFTTILQSCEIKHTEETSVYRPVSFEKNRNV